MRVRSIGLLGVVTLLLTPAVAAANKPTGWDSAPARAAKLKKCPPGYTLVTHKVRRHGHKRRVSTCVKQPASGGGAATTPLTVPSHLFPDPSCDQYVGNRVVASPPVDEGATPNAPSSQAVAWRPDLYWSNSADGPWHLWSNGFLEWQPRNQQHPWYDVGTNANEGNGYESWSPQSGFYWRVGLYLAWYPGTAPSGSPVIATYEWHQMQFQYGDPAVITVYGDSCYFP